MMWYNAEVRQDGRLYEIMMGTNGRGETLYEKVSYSYVL
jgi:hypothetical protein